MTAAAAGGSATDLGPDFSGEVLGPHDPGYDETRKLFNGRIDLRPAVIARCRSAADVRVALAHAQTHGLEVAVRGGGHSTPGYSSCDDGLMLDLSLMKTVEVDPESRTARVAPGATWGELDAATQEHGLAVTGGRVSDTGVAGLTLGSGSGWLGRTIGLTGDNLVAAEVVTPAGEVVIAGEAGDPELLWGLRGGGGNFGVVTEFTFRLHPIGPIILAGMLIHPRDRARELLAFYRDFIADAADEVSGGVALIHAPPAPFVPEELHLKPIVSIVVCYSGPIEEGERALAPLREFGPPLIDMVQPMPYVALQQMLDAGAPKGIHEYFRIGFFERFDAEAIDVLVSKVAEAPSPMTQVVLEPFGGAMSRLPEDATALPRPRGPFAYHALSLWPDPAADDANVAWTRELSDLLRPYTFEAAFPNFIADDEGQERLKAAFGAEKHARLVALKDRYDPGNVLRRNQNIRPSGVTS